MLALGPKASLGGRRDPGCAPSLHMPPPGKCLGMKGPDRSFGPTAPGSPIPNMELPAHGGREPPHLPQRCPCPNPWNP